MSSDLRAPVGSSAPPADGPASAATLRVPSPLSPGDSPPPGGPASPAAAGPRAASSLSRGLIGGARSTRSLRGEGRTEAPPVPAAATALSDWLRQTLPTLLSRTALGIFCAGQGLQLDRLISPLAPVTDTCARVASHLLQDPQGEDPLLSFAAALVQEEVITGPAAAELSTLVQALAAARGLAPPAARAAATPRPPLYCQPLWAGVPLALPQGPGAQASFARPVVVGRDAEMAALDQAWQDGARVMALTGPPGCGKSTLLQRWLAARGLLDPRRWEALHLDGLFVWSFTADPDVGSFLRAAADYAEGRPPLGHRLLTDEDARQEDLARLRRALNREGGHVLLVLDGLERFQVTQEPAEVPLGDPRSSQELRPPRRVVPTDELWEPSLRALLSELAAVDGEAGLLCTLEREPPSLQPWRGSGFVPVPLAQLRPEAGAQLLRQCAVVRGGEADSERRSMEHRGHALALELFGRYLHAYYNGDARAVPVRELPPGEEFNQVPEAPTLGRVLKAQVQALTDRQRGLLDLCVILPGPTSLTALLALAGVANEHGADAKPPPDPPSLPQGVLGVPDPRHPLAPLAVDALLAPLRGPAWPGRPRLQGEDAPAPGRPRSGESTSDAAPPVSARSATTGRGELSPLQVRDLRDQLVALGRLGLLRLYDLSGLGGVGAPAGAPPDASAPSSRSRSVADEALLIDIHPLLRRLLYKSWLDARVGRAVPSSGAGGPAQDPAEVLPKAQDTAVLDLLEQLVLVALQAGLLSEAHDLLAIRLGGYRHLGRATGEYRRLLGVLRILSPVLATVAEGDPLWTRRCARTLAWEAATLCDLGQLSAALAVTEGSGNGADSVRYGLPGGGRIPGALVWQIDAYLLLGQLRTARELAGTAMLQARSVASRVLAAVQQARVLLFLGETSLARLYLIEAELLLREQPGALIEWNGMALRDLLERERVQLLLRVGDTRAARRHLHACATTALRDGHGKDLAQIDILQGEIARRERDPLDASQAIHRALSWGSRSGDVEVLVRAGLCHARIRMDAGNLDGAASAIGMALPAAQEMNLGVDRIDLLLCRGQLGLRRGELQAAEADARDALAYATAPDCGYLWGEADALHLLSMVLLSGHALSTRILEASTHLTDEIELREQLQDPRAAEARWLLRRLMA